MDIQEFLEMMKVVLLRYPDGKSIAEPIAVSRNDSALFFNKVIKYVTDTIELIEKAYGKQRYDVESVLDVIHSTKLRILK